MQQGWLQEEHHDNKLIQIQHTYTYIHTYINGLTPRCRRPPFKGGAAGNGQNGPHMAVSKPNRNSLGGLGMYHGRKLLRRVVRF